MRRSFRILFFLAFFAYGNMAFAQLPNEKFGKPSNLEWDFAGWGDAIDDDAVILCKTMKVTYQLSSQVSNNIQGSAYVSIAEGAVDYNIKSD